MKKKLTYGDMQVMPQVVEIATGLKGLETQLNRVETKIENINLELDELYNVRRQPGQSEYGFHRESVLLKRLDGYEMRMKELWKKAAVICG